MIGRIESGKPALYSISHNGNNTSVTYTHSQIIKIVDNTSYNVDWTNVGADRVISVVASTDNTEMFRSISFVPQGTLATASFEKKVQNWSMYQIHQKLF
ncbi:MULTISPECIES: hypothetical protein [unclassified Flavobacterium]|uniref:hypothetical protein n=1 Tax=unclassified Flavobacterium TaxID=196869 RepID=UPI0025C554BE|nr:MULTISPECIES: hypothetical protein [unclassified Flavobacterium]